MAEQKETRVVNRRGGRRRPPRTTIKVECRKGTLGLGPNLADGFLDISEGGVRIILKSALEPKSEVEVQLTGFGMQKPIRVVSTICWVLPLEDGRFCVGVEFQKRLTYRDVQFLAIP